MRGQRQAAAEQCARKANDDDDDDDEPNEMQARERKFSMEPAPPHSVSERQGEGSWAGGRGEGGETQ